MTQQIRDEQIRLITISLTIVAAVAASVALEYTRSFMVPFVLSLFISTMVSPLVDFQVRRRVPRAFAILSTIVIVLAMLAAIGYAAVLAVQAIINTADEYSENFVDMSAKMVQWLKEANIDIDRHEIGVRLQSTLISLAPQTAGVAVNILSTSMLIVIFVIFLLAGRESARSSDPIYAEIEAKVRSYVLTKIVLSAITGTLVGIILSVLGLRMASVFGMMAFFLNFIPSLGSVIATMLPIPIAVAQYQSPWMWLLVVILPGAVQMAIGNGLEPKLMGEGMKLHPVVILLALAFWGLIWGVMGMVLSVPITASIRIVLMQFEITRPVGELLAGKLPKLPG